MEAKADDWDKCGMGVVLYHEVLPRWYICRKYNYNVVHCVEIIMGSRTIEDYLECQTCV